MFTPWNACPACPARPVECETYSSGVSQSDRTGACPVGSGNPTGVNSSSACLLAKSDRIGGDHLDLLNQGHVNPLGLSSEFRIPSSEFGNAPYALCYALCPLRHALYGMHHACYPAGVQLFFEEVSHKAPSSQKEGGAFLL